MSLPSNTSRRSFRASTVEILSMTARSQSDSARHVPNSRACKCRTFNEVSEVAVLTVKAVKNTIDRRGDSDVTWCVGLSACYLSR
jgi:hypothetical protein